MGQENNAQFPATTCTGNAAIWQMFCFLFKTKTLSQEGSKCFFKKLYLLSKILAESQFLIRKFQLSQLAFDFKICFSKNLMC